MKKVLYLCVALLFFNVSIANVAARDNFVENYVDDGGGSSIVDDALGMGTYEKIVCGDIEMPYLFPQIVRVFIGILQIAAPVIIIILGSFDLLKGVMGQDEKKIQEGQKTFFRRLLVGVTVFLVVALVEFVIGLIAPKDNDVNMWSCVDCFINGDCSNIKKWLTIYVK